MKNNRIKSIIMLNRILLLVTYLVFWYRWYDIYRTVYKHGLNYTNGSLYLKDTCHLIMLLFCIFIIITNNKRVLIGAMGIIGMVFLTALTFLPITLKIGDLYDNINTILLIIFSFLCFVELVYYYRKILVVPRDKIDQVIKEIESNDIKGT